MEKIRTIKGTKFLDNEISGYGFERGYVDYKALASTFDAVLCNKIMQDNYEYWELVNGIEYDEENDEYYQVFQYFIISSEGYKILSRFTDEIVYYNEELDLYVWGVTHCGTSWDYVLTDIKIEK